MRTRSGARSSDASSRTRAAASRIARSGEPARSVSDDTWMSGSRVTSTCPAITALAQRALNNTPPTTFPSRLRRVELAFAGDHQVDARRAASSRPTASATTSKPERSVAPSAARPPASPPAAPRAREVADAERARRAPRSRGGERLDVLLGRALLRAEDLGGVDEAGLDVAGDGRPGTAACSRAPRARRARRRCWPSRRRDDRAASRPCAAAREQQLARAARVGAQRVVASRPARARWRGAISITAVPSSQQAPVGVDGLAERPGDPRREAAAVARGEQHVERALAAVGQRELDGGDAGRPQTRGHRGRGLRRRSASRGTCRDSKARKVTHSIIRDEMSWSTHPPDGSLFRIAE